MHVLLGNFEHLKVPGLKVLKVSNLTWQTYYRWHGRVHRPSHVDNRPTVTQGAALAISQAYQILLGLRIWLLP